MIVYLGFAKPGEDERIDPIGTGFLFAHAGATYLVTAAHVAVDLKGCPFAIRLNQSSDGKGKLDHVESAKWYFHADSTVDVALMVYRPPKWAVAEFARSELIVDPRVMQNKRIGVGDLAYVIGIFKPLKAREKNIPVVHTGHIASMADDEPLLTSDWREGAKPDDTVHIHAYLLQVHTMKQASGSPVFVRRSLEMLEATTKEDEKGKLRNWSHGTVWLLGVWHGAWSNDPKTLQQIRDVSTTIGTGMGVCTPIYRLEDILNSDELKDQRAAMRKKIQEQEPRIVPQSSKSVLRVRGTKRVSSK